MAGASAAVTLCLSLTVVVELSAGFAAAASLPWWLACDPCADGQIDSFWLEEARFSVDAGAAPGADGSCDSQSAGGFGIRQKFPAVSSAIPSSHAFPSCPMAAQSATAPFTCRWSAVSNRTLLPMGIARGERTPHPCVFTTSVWHCSRNATCGSRLLMCTGICQRTRVLRLIACLSTVGATDKWLPLTYSAAAERSPGCTAMVTFVQIRSTVNVTSVLQVLIILGQA